MPKITSGSSDLTRLFNVHSLSNVFEKVHVGPDELSMWGDLGEKMIVLSAESDQHMKVGNI